MLLLLAKILAVAFVYGAAVEPRVLVTEQQPGAVPRLPQAWEGKQIAVFADMQVGMWWANRDAVRRAVRKVVEIKPAAVLIAGDFVYDAEYSAVSQSMEALALLQPLLDNHIPTYGVLGNHDYELMNEHSRKETDVARRVRFALDSAGIRMLDNKVAVLIPPGADSTPANALYLVGVGDKWAMNDKPQIPLSQIPDSVPRILFMHNPDSFAHIPAGEAPLAVAAHTHGMQLGIPWVSAWMWRTYFSDEGAPVAGWGHNYGEAGNHVYVNRGIGFSILPLRIGAPPELTIFTLGRAP